MKFSTAILFGLASTAAAFAPATPLNLSAGRSSRHVSSLQMVADDAKVCLVTGASRGLGASIALELGKQGQKVVVNYAGSEDKALEVVEQIKAAGGDAIAVQADCSDQKSIQAMFKQIIEEYGSCDVLINNAGITKDGLLMRMKPAQWQDVIDINLTGVFYTTQEFFKAAAKKKMSEGAGRIINISSVVGQMGNAGQANYAAAKGGVIGLTMSNAREFTNRGVTVNCVCPGYIETDMTGKLSEDIQQKVVATIPLGRMGKPEEVAGMCRFLALDPAAAYITGHTFNVDGGMAIGC
jgi:3-oxoacyl-[acyl-carrier protein] reductase|mmetsp:Transcript_28530/g.57423  ORF Transcript_28530/g.57423 Transcript_28530/m.57423 type:complete len:295 (+) Transcript_28530:91-975(+)|eukprot:CAMPEP_0113392548 /NCGR_PEP_ID=MMETSP0013_2-20120614/11345_1 /TAXON_ID=2843 ORGANISM="Skeletonema costatum, Strain 1716" /NCGR_SAMPLE_ID=MMETSP0013_2 /ASSEMBLY_ACC=CAM_ASM_000158 /LENGTH=294 /DNA_ID=CAMNT_0000275951 /DNA_START=91 /DNA_END=975 /DNA_ORIENTATION=+ /assembly_acc=CAM_ASM_000158